MTELNFLDNFLLNNIHEKNIVNRIKFMANPRLPINFKRDFSTFFFVWNAIKNYLTDEHIVSIIFVVHKIANEGRKSLITFPDYSEVSIYKNFIKKYLLRFNSTKRLIVLRELGLLKINRN